MKQISDDGVQAKFEDIRSQLGISFGADRHVSDQEVLDAICRTARRATEQSVRTGAAQLLNSLAPSMEPHEISFVRGRFLAQTASATQNFISKTAPRYGCGF